MYVRKENERIGRFFNYVLRLDAIPDEATKRRFTAQRFVDDGRIGLKEPVYLYQAGKLVDFKWFTILAVEFE